MVGPSVQARDPLLTPSRDQLQLEPLLWIERVKVVVVLPLAGVMERQQVVPLATVKLALHWVGPVGPPPTWIVMVWDPTPAQEPVKGEEGTLQSVGPWACPS